MYQIFVQTIFELQIAFNGINFHIFACLTKDGNESIMRLKGVNGWVERLNRPLLAINYLKIQSLLALDLSAQSS